MAVLYADMGEAVGILSEGLNSGLKKTGLRMEKLIARRLMMGESTGFRNRLEAIL
jgi:hypothetical protein